MEPTLRSLPPDAPEGDGWHLGRFVCDIQPWTMSAVVHLALIVVLGLWFLPRPEGFRSPLVMLETGADLSTLDQGLGSQDARASTSASRSVSSPMMTMASAVQPMAEVRPQLMQTVALKSSLTEVGDLVSHVPHDKLDAPVQLGREPTLAAGGGVQAAAGVSNAVDGVLGGIRGELDNGDLLVVWLLDASISLVDDRRQISERIEPFYQEMDGRKRDSSHLLMNAAVAYGGQVMELVPPTKFGLKIINAVNKVPVDQTGLENVMGAVQWCLGKYARPNRTMMIVVWTDESGDDTMMLEDTISLCRRSNAIVSVVGPSAVLGSEIGNHLYVDQATGYRFLLPVKRGPETSLPEKPLLPYWHEEPVRAWSRGGAQLADNMPWYGGPYREGLLSGFGPYALTRLALQTGGHFTVLDRPGTGGPFEFETMQPYLPDYGSAAEYIDSLKYSKLRRAISNTAMLTYRERLPTPTLSFISERSDSYPFRVRTPYITAAEFRGDLKPVLAQEKNRMDDAARVIEQALEPFTEAGLEHEYEREESPRWKAWYDLSRGRLLAMSVRHAEYALTCQMIFAQADFLDPQTNHLDLHASSRLLSTSSELKNRAAEAERLLKRCIEKNPDTPWAYLAQWELDHSLGLDVEQIVIPAPQPRPPGPNIPRPAMPVLPNL